MDATHVSITFYKIVSSPSPRCENLQTSNYESTREVAKHEGSVFPLQTIIMMLPRATVFFNSSAIHVHMLA